MALKIGDRVEYKDNTVNKESLQGKIIVVEKDSGNSITSYFVMLDQGLLVQFTPHNLNWHKLEEQ